MALSAIARKLRLQSASRALILNAPEGYLELLGELPAEPETGPDPAGEFDFVQLFVANQDELEQSIAGALAALMPDGMLWVSYPKGGSGVATDLNRDKLRAALSQEGIRPVAQVSIDDVWSAMRFRPSESVRA